MNRENRAVRKRRAHLVIGALVAALAVLAAVPAFASALIVVDSPGDQAGASRCEAPLVAGECTLRAAIEEAGIDPGPDLIEFAAGVSEIEPATALPAITEPVTLAGQSVLAGSYLRPSVGIKAPPGAAGLTIESSDVTVQQMAFGGGRVGIEVLDGSDGFIATGDWFGLRLNATAEAIDTAGIVLGPGADGATIGARQLEMANRNVFTNSEVGVELDGASDARVLGNYFGVDPEGKGPAATLVNGVLISDAGGPSATPAVHNEIGGVLTAAEGETPACDGACNVIATEGGFGAGVFIAGESTGPSEPTTVRGNFIGLAADGITPAGENPYGIFVVALSSCGAGPSDVTIGGTAATEGNYIEGGQVGIYAEGAENFTAAGNSIGIAADGSESTPPEAAGIAVCAEGVTRTGHVTDNRMKLSQDAVGIESSHGRAEITGNTIDGSSQGILLNEENGGHGDLVQGNTITGPDTNGIEIENDSNVVTGNTITKAGRYAILVEETEHNRIGGDGPGEANTVVESGTFQFEEGGAIVIFGLETSRNEIAANTGFGNFGPFIQLVGQGSKETPNGLKPPTVGTALQSVAIGSAAPGATVRVFNKASAEPGTLGSLLAVVKADLTTGGWKATYAKQPVGTLIAATQTSAAGTPQAGTSEISAMQTAIPDPPEEEKEKGGGDEGGGGGNPGPGNGTPRPPPPPAIAKVAPKVRITSSPKKTTTATKATFKFKATNVTGAKFECKLDSAKWASCKSPKTYKKLKVGKHGFRVRAKANGLTSAVAKYQFTVKS